MIAAVKANSQVPRPANLTALVPAAGYATRLQPLQGSKEMLVVRGRPVIEHVVSRLTAASPATVRVITRPDKEDVRSHAAARGWKVVLGTPNTVGESILLGTADLDADDVVLVGFPDTLIESADAAVRTVAALTPSVDAALGLFRSDEPSRGDVVDVGADGMVTSVRPKPPAPSGDLVWGLLAARAGSLGGLRAVSEPGDLWDAWARRGRVRGVVLPGYYLDIGTPAALAAYSP